MISVLCESGEQLGVLEVVTALDAFPLIGRKNTRDRVFPHRSLKVCDEFEGRSFGEPHLRMLLHSSIASDAK